MWQLTCWQIFFPLMHLQKTLLGSQRKKIVSFQDFLPPSEPTYVHWGGYNLHHLILPPNTSNNSSKRRTLLNENLDKTVVVCRTVFGCFIRRVFFSRMEQPLQQISPFIFPQTKFLSREGAKLHIDTWPS